jgi:hypothetical protein
MTCIPLEIRDKECKIPLSCSVSLFSSSLSAPVLCARYVVECVRSLGIEPIRISYRSPWQNGTAERWILSCRRELLEHVVVFGERRLVRLVRSYISYYHEDRGHLGLDKDTPDSRPVTLRPSSTAKVVALPRMSGLHHPL